MKELVHVFSDDFGNLWIRKKDSTTAELMEGENPLGGWAKPFEVPRITEDFQKDLRK